MSIYDPLVLDNGRHWRHNSFGTVSLWPQRTRRKRLCMHSCTARRHSIFRHRRGGARRDRHPLARRRAMSAQKSRNFKNEKSTIERALDEMDAIVGRCKRLVFPGTHADLCFKASNSYRGAEGASVRINSPRRLPKAGHAEF